MEKNRNAHDKIKQEVRNKVLASLPIGFFEENDLEDVELYIDDLVKKCLPWHQKKLSEQISKELISEFIGFGILEPLIADPMISEIMINSHERIFIEKNGRIEKSDVRFRDDAHYLSYVYRLVESAGKKLNELEPIAGGRLPDGSRINVVIPPIVNGEPVITIRKFWKYVWDLEELVNMNTISMDMAEFLKNAVKGRQNIFIAGGAGVGKTTLANALAGEIPYEERVVVIEDITEIRMSHENVVYMETRPANLEGKGEVDLRRLVKNALHMRPDRLILGEILGEEALDVLQAMNTGHSGSMSTIHASSSQDALSRLETLVYMGGLSSANPNVVKRLIAASLDLVVFMERQKDGLRLVKEISRVYWNADRSELALESLFSLDG